MVDMAIRYCVAAVIENKTAETIVKALFVVWITTVGAPVQIFLDNGGEFNNEVFDIVGDQFGVE